MAQTDQPLRKSGRMSPDISFSQFSESEDLFFMDALLNEETDSKVKEFGVSSCDFIPASKLLKLSPTFHGIDTSTPVKSPKASNSACINKTKFKDSTSFDVSPIVMPASSLSSGIRNMLKRNTSFKSPLIQAKKNENSIEKALEEAKQVEFLLSESDLGPFYGLPMKVKNCLKSFRRIDTLYEWQDECLKLPAIKQRKNLIYSLPTSGGKTLVAEILIFREILCRQKNAMLVLPYVSLVQEKVRSLSLFAVELDFVIEECAGSKGTIPPRKRKRRNTLYICTIEKAHALANSLIETDRINEIGLLVADEIHMIGETSGGRGAVLESVLSKVLYTSKDTHIIGMSATVSNMAELKEFLKADVYENVFRPVELKEFIKVSDQLFEFDPKKHKQPVFVRRLEFDYTQEMSVKDPDMITGLVLEVVPDKSCLIFCPTKKHCENVASMLCNVLPSSMKDVKKDEKSVLYNALATECNGNVCSVLARTIKFGVAYHHSGLTTDERRLIEEAYSAGILCCLACTSTLAAGVNLPAKRVILRAPYIAQEFITLSRYKQMIGRAGRAGLDSSGESILMIKQGEETKVQNLLCSNAETCKSSLIEQEHIQMLLLSLVGLGIACTCSELHDFMDHTLAAVQCRQMGGTPNALFTDTLKILSGFGLLKQTGDNKQTYAVTKLGKAAFMGGIPASDVQDLWDMLRKGLKALSLYSYLHLLFIVSPCELMQQIPLNGDLCFEGYMALSSSDQEVAETIGISEALIMIMASGRSLKTESRQLMHHFYITLILYDLYNQSSIWSVSKKYQIHRGTVQNLLTSASTFGSTLVHFCQELDEFWAYQRLLPDFVKQLSYCVTMELIPLMELPAVKKGRARQLYQVGYKSLRDVASADPRDLVSKINHMPKKVAAQIVSAAKMMLLEKAEALQEEAELLVENFDTTKNTTAIFDDPEFE